jgi:hypothetical protein
VPPRGIGGTMIKPTGHGFKVTSESGKNLSKPNLSHGQAVKRLQQVEFFKHKGKVGDPKKLINR